MQSARLTKLVELIPGCELLADVGCDHGYLGILALQAGKARHVAFVDISQPSLDKARRNCPDEYQDVVSFHCQDGLGSLNADCAIIAGMGGLETISILQQARYLPDKLVLQPMRNQRDVREYLTQEYDITTDIKFRDGKFYDAIVAVRSNTPTTLTEMELEFGKSNFLNPGDDFVSFLQMEQAKLDAILLGTQSAEVVKKRNLVHRALEIVLAK